MAEWPFSPEHDELRASIRAFVETELAPYASEWERRCDFPNDVFRRMGELGLLGLTYPEEYGGGGGDHLCNIVLAEEMTRGNSRGVAMAVAVQTDMAVPPVFKFGTEEQKRKYLVPAIAGEKIFCLGISEPDAGSDVAAITTTARNVDGGWSINGRKTFITNGRRADGGEPAIGPVAMAKLFTSELAVLVADECVQVHGGYGYMDEFPAERALRDARLGPIGGGTSEIMKEIIGKSLGL
jgi:alkylation response protein AidB-like acyl-CoA dehydrogenase